MSASGGILSGAEIELAVQAGVIDIAPFDRLLVNPASVDLRLGRRVKRYVSTRLLDCKDPHMETAEREIGEDGLVLHPGELYLMHTEERVYTRLFVPVLDGKSSIGRLGVQVHLTAGYGDPGFDGQYTLEVTTVYPVRVYAGMRFCQMRFHTIVGELRQYEGNYVGEHSDGPVPSQVWKQFK